MYLFMLIILISFGELINIVDTDITLYASNEISLELYIDKIKHTRV
jgi:hypothetical protein